MTKVCFALPTFEQVEYTIECLPEDSSVRGNCSAIDEQTDKETEDYIIDQLENGNEWAWCCVKVTASYKGHKCSDYLGHCSYKDEKEFMADGYYEDMKRTAFDELVKTLQSLND